MNSKITCDVCGGPLLINAGGQSATCQVCGMEHSIERVREKLGVAQPKAPGLSAAVSTATAAVSSAIAAASNAFTPKTAAPETQPHSQPQPAVRHSLASRYANLTESAPAASESTDPVVVQSPVTEVPQTVQFTKAPTEIPIPPTAPRAFVSPEVKQAIQNSRLLVTRSLAADLVLHKTRNQFHRAAADELMQRIVAVVYDEINPLLKTKVILEHNVSPKALGIRDSKEAFYAKVPLLVRRADTTLPIMGIGVYTPSSYRNQSSCNTRDGVIAHFGSMPRFIAEAFPNENAYIRTRIFEELNNHNPDLFSAIVGENNVKLIDMTYMSQNIHILPRNGKH